MHRWYPLLVLAEFTAFWAVLYSCRGQVRARFQEVPRKAWFALAAVVLFGFFARARGLHVYETYFDGYEYGVTTQSLARTGEFHTCSLRVDGLCYQKWLPTHPPASNLLYALVMAVRGLDESDFFDATVAVGALSIVVVFAAAFLLFKETGTALWAALLFAAIPIHVKLSSAGMLEIGEVFYALLLLCALLLLKDKPGRRTLLLAALATLLLIQSRAEAVLFLTLVPLPAYLYCRDRDSRRAALGVGFVLLALALVDVFYVSRVTTGYNGLGVERNLKGFTLAHLAQNMMPNLAFYFDNAFHPLPYTVLALIGAYGVFRKKIAVEHLFLLAWFAAFSLLFTLYGPDFGRYAYYESQHFALITYPPLVLAAAAGITALLGAARRGKALIGVLFAALIVSNAYAFDARYNRVHGPASPHLFAEHAFVRSLRGRLPANSFIITVNPNIVFAATDFSGSEMANFAQEEAALSRLAPRGRFDYYFLEGTWCDTFSWNDNDSCAVFKRRFSPRLVASSPDGRDKLYRMP